MSEKFHIAHPSNERRETAMVAHETVDLHNQKAGIVVNGLRPLIPKDVAVREYGITGDILATITLPGDSATEPSKEIAVVDFGPDVDGDHPVPVAAIGGRPIPMMGKATTRYGLNALNYTPKGHMATYVPLAPGERIVLGTDWSEASFRLGLNPSDEIGNELIEPRHATIALADGVLGVADHSTEGTRLTLADEQSVSAIQGPAERLAGSLALLGAEIQPLPPS